jgi:hypothetical protein
MSKENTKTINVVVSVDCWRELNILRYRKNYNNLGEIVKDILETYTNKIISKENNNS